MRFFLIFWTLIYANLVEAGTLSNLAFTNQQELTEQQLQNQLKTGTLHEDIKGALRARAPKPEPSYPANSCDKLSRASKFRSGTFLQKHWRFKSLGEEFLSAQSLKKFNEEFLRFTNSFTFGLEVFADKSEHLKQKSERERQAILETRSRLLDQVAWNPRASFKVILAWMKREPRVQLAVHSTFCEEAEANKEVVAVPGIGFKDCQVSESLLEEKFKESSFISRVELRLLRVLAESMTLDEMISTRVIPTEQARGRLYFSLAEISKIKLDLVLACQQSADFAENVYPSFLVFAKSASGFVVTASPLWISQDSSESTRLESENGRELPFKEETLRASLPKYLEALSFRGQRYSIAEKNSLCHTSEVKLLNVCKVEGGQ